MTLRPWIRPVIGSLAFAGLATAAYFTRESWRPYVFPAATHETAPAKDEPEAKDRITLSTQAQQNLQLVVENCSPREYWRSIVLPGAIVDRPGESDRSVHTRVAGVVSEIKARPGDTVKPDDSLFSLQLVSEFVQTAQSDLHKSARELQFAVEKRNRIAKQVEEKTTPGSALIDEENQVKRLSTQLEAHRRQLKLFGFSHEQISRAESGDLITEITIVAPNRPGASPISSNGAAPGVPEALYELQDLKVRLGDQVQAGQALCTLADHQHLLVEGNAFKSEARALATAAEKRLPIRADFADEQAGDWPPLEPLLIHHLSNQVDPLSRTFSFYMTIDNQGQTFTRDGKTFFVWRFRPGQRVRLRVPVEKFATPGPDGKTDVPPFVLHAGAVVREGPESFVFVQSGDVFIRKPVRVLHEDRTDVVVANDGSITEADYVVQNEAAALNRALKAGAAGGE